MSTNIQIFVLITDLTVHFTPASPPAAHVPGLHSFPTVEEEAQLALRRPASEKERLFSEETVRKKEEQRGRLAALNSHNSIEDGEQATPCTLKRSSIKKIIVFHLKRLNILCLRPFLEKVLKLFFCI